MIPVKAVLKNASPYLKDKMNLPVNDVESAIPFYETILNFEVISKNNSPNKSAILTRDNIQIGLAENGGDPTQEGCFFEVDDVDLIVAEFRSNGLKKEVYECNTEKHGNTTWKIFYVVAPDGLCYCFGQRQ
jgi:catechol 2,3-dioxygenase-like lactoylglutathione lyase family enzyme